MVKILGSQHYPARASRLSPPGNASDSQKIRSNRTTWTGGIVICMCFQNCCSEAEQTLIFHYYKTSPKAIRDIYAGPNALPISDMYKRFGNREKGQMFVQEEPKHREKRKKIIHLFSKPSIAALEPVLHENSAKLLAYIESNKGSPIDLLFWDRMLNMDIAGKDPLWVRK
jgi:hypothetical protein